MKAAIGREKEREREILCVCVCVLKYLLKNKRDAVVQALFASPLLSL